MSGLPWKRVEPTVVTKIGWRTIISKTFIMPTGKRAIFDTINAENQDFVVVLAATASNDFVIARQFRTGPEVVLDELPGGAINHGESPKHAAKRELLEETGYSAKTMIYKGYFYKDGLTNSKCHVYFASNCTIIAEQSVESYEDVLVCLISAKTMISNAYNAKTTYAAAVLLGQDELLRISNFA